MKRRSWRRGDHVTVELPEGGSLTGQVWSLAPEDGHAWLALASGRFAKVSPDGVVKAERGRVIGKVAA